MIAPLFGLEATLADEECERAEFHAAAGGGVEVFVRRDADLWGREDEDAHPLHTRELCAKAQAELAGRCERLVCVLAQEQVVYEAQRGGVRVQRLPRDDGSGGPRGADLEPVAEALGIPRSRRRAKLAQAAQFARIVADALGGRRAAAGLRLLDLACGRSYLGFVLAHLLGAEGHRVTLHGVDSEPALIDKCRQIAGTLGWSNATFEAADLASHAVEQGAWDVAVCLHGCDTLTDEAIRIAWEGRVPLLFVAPCCQHELRHQWRRHPLAWIARYGLLEQRLADVVTDGFRCLVLEALGYKVRTIRFVEPEVTPKNLLLEARLTSGLRPARARDAGAFLQQFGVRPRLAAVLEAAGLIPPPRRPTP